VCVLKRYWGGSLEGEERRKRRLEVKRSRTVIKDRNKTKVVLYSLVKKSSWRAEGETVLCFGANEPVRIQGIKVQI